MKILIVEDEVELPSSIASYLQHEKYRCETALDFPEAKNKIIDFIYDCLIVDVGLPRGSLYDSN